MNEPQNLHPDIVQEAIEITEAAQAMGFPLRLIGGIAISLQCPAALQDVRLQRSYGDLDFVTLAQWNTKTKALFANRGYSENKAFNALHGYQRLLFFDERNARKVDIFLDRMQMCHTIDFRQRLNGDSRTLSVTDLLLSKLQIVELNEKDLKDVIALFIDRSKEIDSTYLANLLAQDWGFYTTSELNLKKIRAFVNDEGYPAQIIDSVEQLLMIMEKYPKSLKWNLRAKVGQRLRWYELPEEAR